MTKYFLLTLLASSSLASANAVVVYNSNLKKAVLNCGGKTLPVTYLRNQKEVVKVSDISEQMPALMEQCTFRASQTARGEIVLDVVGVKGLGGGPATGQVAYWTTRIGGYGCYIAACWFDPHLIAEYHLVAEGIECAASVALVAGTMAPTP